MVARSVINVLAGLVLSCALFLAVSCTPGMCFEETNAFLEASFYLRSTGKLRAPDSLTLYGIGMDTMRYWKASNIQPALIPLKSSAGSCTFVIKINGISDTISFEYTSYPHLISKECGYTFYHTLDTVYSTKNTIDTILIKQRNVTTFNDQNIYIYY